jgi:hypothetical protein
MSCFLIFLHSALDLCTLSMENLGGGVERDHFKSPLAS